jgi:hypothetical protein
VYTHLEALASVPAWILRDSFNELVVGSQQFATKILYLLSLLYLETDQHDVHRYYAPRITSNYSRS